MDHLADLFPQGHICHQLINAMPLLVSPEVQERVRSCLFRCRAGQGCVLILILAGSPAQVDSIGPVLLPGLLCLLRGLGPDRPTRRRNKSLKGQQRGQHTGRRLQIEQLFPCAEARPVS